MNKPPVAGRKRLQFDLHSLFLLMAAVGCFMLLARGVYPEQPLPERLKLVLNGFFLLAILSASIAVLLRKRARPLRVFLWTMIACCGLPLALNALRAYLH
ncbi:MAG: hypothetical protein AB7O59_19225 [Pirellulales bacterium]